MLRPDKLYIGTSGWSYPRGEGTWTGYFYPNTRIDELEYYSRYFNAVEINSSFYRPPSPDVVIRWVRKVPADFMFTAKLWQKFTHPRMFEAASGADAAISVQDIDLFRESIEPLARSGKLGAVLAQFPPSFVNDSQGQHRLMAVIRTFRQYRLAVELRHRSWSDDVNTIRLLDENKVVWAHIDEPKFDFSISQDLPVTGDFAYFRFHGRNAGMWWRGDVETRYKYLYSGEEIRELSGKVRETSRRVGLAFTFFNNHWRGYAPRNALDIMKALGVPLKTLPLPESSED